MRALTWLTFAVTLTGCGSGGGVKQGKCLTDAQICQFTVGVSTMQDIQKALGNADIYLGTEEASYICQQLTGQQVVHNDQVAFQFDSRGVLTDITVLRMGSGATPPPACAN